MMTKQQERDLHAKIRALYNQACHGAGAEPRREARRELDRIAATSADFTLGTIAMLNDLGLDIDAYFASRPL